MYKFIELLKVWAYVIALLVAIALIDENYFTTNYFISGKWLRVSPAVGGDRTERTEDALAQS